MKKRRTEPVAPESQSDILWVGFFFTKSALLVMSKKERYSFIQLSKVIVVNFEVKLKTDIVRRPFGDKNDVVPAASSVSQT